jgi:hypothetical protein
VKRLKNYNFYSSETNIINPSGHNATHCSQGSDYQIDLIGPIPCPVTSLASNASPALNETIPELAFTFARQDHYPLVHFRLSEYAFCESLSDNDKSPGRTSNYVLENNYQYECTSTDTRTVLLDSQGEADLFRSNPSTASPTQRYSCSLPRCRPTRHSPTTTTTAWASSAIPPGPTTAETATPTA